jgi:hypothetical protein
MLPRVITALLLTALPCRCQPCCEAGANCYGSTSGSVTGDTEIYVHPTRYKRIIEELKAAGFGILVSQLPKQYDQK